MEQFGQKITFPPTPDEQQRKAQAKKQLTQVVSQAHEVLMEATTVFPFTLFPDTITVDRTKFTVARRSFFKIAQVTSMNVKDILNVTANVGPIFGSLIITTRFFDKDPARPYEINWLRRNDAIEFKRILQGCVIAQQQHVDIAKLSKDELVRLLNQLGAATNDI